MSHLTKEGSTPAAEQVRVLLDHKRKITWQGPPDILDELELIARERSEDIHTSLRVDLKREEDGAKLVDMDVWGENQRQEVTMKGTATVRLPSNGQPLGESA